MNKLYHDWYREKRYFPQNHWMESQAKTKWEVIKYFEEIQNENSRVWRQMCFKYQISLAKLKHNFAVIQGSFSGRNGDGTNYPAIISQKGEESEYIC